MLLHCIILIAFVWTTGTDAISTHPPVCEALKARHLGMGCCGNDDEVTPVCVAKHADVNSPGAPTIPGVYNGPNTRIVLSMAPDYAPYTSWSGTPLELGGFNKAFADLMEPICGIKVDFLFSAWSRCWTTKPNYMYFPEITEYIGDDIKNGIVHGCTAYTHAKGERGLVLEFSHSILRGLKTAGILTRIENGSPIVSSSVTNYTGIKLGDVSGWAPTPDTFVFNTNYCTGSKFVKEDNILSADGNEEAINALLNGTFDAVYIYADQINNFMNSGDTSASGFGTTFTYIHTGLNEWSYNGTTLAISKRGSGLKDLLDPCIYKVSQTKNYTDMCEEYWSPSACIQNEFSSVGVSYWYDSQMDARTDSKTCSDGYCTCTEN